MIAEVNNKLSEQNISLKLTEAALQEITRLGYDPQFGARPMRRTIQRTVENSIATRILEGNASPGTVITLDKDDITKPS